MKRKYKLHIMANDCPICGGALYKGKPCEACGFSWTAWKGGPVELTAKVISVDDAAAIAQGFKEGIETDKPHIRDAINIMLNQRK